MYQDSAVTEIENTRRQMYVDLKRFETMVGSTHLFKTLEDSLEAHLEELRKAMKAREDVGQAFSESLGRVVIERDSLIQRLSDMTEERDQIQQRLHAIDHAYCEQSNLAGAQTREIERLNELNRIAGEELIRVQGIARQHLDDVSHASSVIGANRAEINSLRLQLEARDQTISDLRKKYGRDREDVMSAEKMSDELSEKLLNANSVIAQKELLIVGQRLVIADLYMRLKPSRRSLDQIKKDMASKYAHEFHPAFPGGERCVYCCEVKS